MSEHSEQVAVTDWFKVRHREYHGCLFSIPNGSFLAGSIIQRSKQMNRLKREGFKNGVSDLFLAVPTSKYHGLFLEMKDKGKTKSSVSESQKEHLELMSKQGYCAKWAAGFEEAKKIIDEYIEGE